MEPDSVNPDSVNTDANIDLIARFTVRAGSAGAVTALLTEYAAVVRSERGNLLFEPHREVDRPEVFVVVEKYRNQDAFQAHLDDPANAEFNGMLSEHLLEEVTLTMLTPVLG